MCLIDIYIAKFTTFTTVQWLLIFLIFIIKTEKLFPMLKKKKNSFFFPSFQHNLPKYHTIIPTFLYRDAILHQMEYLSNIHTNSAYFVRTESRVFVTIVSGQTLTLFNLSLFDDMLQHSSYSITIIKDTTFLNSLPHTLFYEERSQYHLSLKFLMSTLEIHSSIFVTIC